MSTITIQKTEYEELISRSVRYERLRSIIEDDIFLSPSSNSAGEVISAFESTKKYNKKFLDSLENGLKRSSYFKK